MSRPLQLLCAAVLALCWSVAFAAPTKVMVTVDVESYAHGDPDKQIWGRQADGEHGIRRIMDLLDKHGLKGTFYLNVYEAAKHGEPTIAEVARVIHQRGHDLQLHTHPGPMFGFKNMQHANYAHQLEALVRGKALIQEWTGKKVIAHRAGAFAANLDTLRAAQTIGLVLDSSLSPTSQNTQLSRQLPPSNLPQRVEGVVELPISYYSQFRFGNWHSFRILDVEASSLDEFKSVVRQFRDANAPVVNILMHSFSFVRFGKANPALEQRFEQLLMFLANEPGVEVVTVSELHPDWASQVTTLTQSAGPVPNTGLWLTYLRAVEHAGEGGANLAVASIPLVMLVAVVLVLMVWRKLIHTRQRFK